MHVTQPWRTGAPWRLAASLLALGVALAPAARAGADDPQPQRGGIPEQQPVTPDLAAAGVLHNQLVWPEQAGQPASTMVTSQDFAGTTIDTRAADDFIIGGTAAWEVTQVDVIGVYFDYGAGVDATVEAVTIQFYLDDGGRPGPLLYSAPLQPSDATRPTGSFSVLLTPSIGLGSGASYWVSVQAQKTNSRGQWMWMDRKAVFESTRPAQWIMPGGSGSCTVWTVLSQCVEGGGPDLRFALTGNVLADTRVAPILTRLEPGFGANRDISLTIRGANFAAGATVSFGGNVLTPQVLEPGRIVVVVPAALVAAYPQTTSVTVINQAPCLNGNCTSNALPFRIANYIYLPTTGRGS